MTTLAFLSRIAPLATALIASVAAFGQTVVYQGIPDGFDFPADQTALLKLRDQQDVPGMRKHSWMVFAGLTQKTASGEAIWETWYSAPTTFSSGPSPQGVRKIERRFTAPRQFTAPGAHPQAVGASLLSFTLFNQETRQQIRSNRYNLSSHLDELNNAFTPTTPAADRHIADFPPRAMSLKTVWWVVKKSGLTAMPVWDAAQNPQLPDGNGYPTWTRVVAVDPSRVTIPSGETADVPLLDKMRHGSRVVPLASLYSFRITQNEIAAVHNSTAPNANTAQIGDYAALVAIHYTTKEIPEWVWSTFWWHDKPNDGPFAQDRPATVRGVWGNYLMYTTFSMETPKGPDGGPNVCFNPWLEARFQNGVFSNCMACHQKAAWPWQDFHPVTRGTLKPDDPLFRNRMRLDFLWSVADQAQ
ncbi:MAG TPA: hypothetical protein VN924_28605 [Bryobacteraceae bacterium]|nr:hypothetical protein [Bryobacteraceae bacterium]